MPIVIIILGILLVAAGLTAFHFRNEARDATKETEAQRLKYINLTDKIKDLRWLLLADWTIDLKWSPSFDDLSDWRLQAPDENHSRHLMNAAERQRELERVRRFNLPNEAIKPEFRPQEKISIKEESL